MVLACSLSSIDFFMVDCMESKLSFARESEGQVHFFKFFSCNLLSRISFEFTSKSCSFDQERHQLKKKGNEADKIYKGVSVLNKIRFARKVFLC
jgi:hypothetical protein